MREYRCEPRGRARKNGRPKGRPFWFSHRRREAGGNKDDQLSLLTLVLTVPPVFELRRKF
jgi:hypothetical protein